MSWYSSLTISSDSFRNLHSGNITQETIGTDYFRDFHPEYIMQEREYIYWKRIPAIQPLYKF
jgi:hypothetical protein